MIEFMNGQRLLDVCAEIADAALEVPVGTVVLGVPVEIPLVWRVEITRAALDQRHGMILDVLLEPSADWSTVRAFLALILRSRTGSTRST